MSVKIADLMRENVITTTPSKPIGSVKEILRKNKISIIPVVDPENELLGIVSSRDLISNDSDDAPISSIMIEKVYSVPAYNDTQIAARMMRNHKIHHLVVTHEKKLVGILSSYDLLKLVEEHRYVPKNPSTPKKGKGKRAQAEN